MLRLSGKLPLHKYNYHVCKLQRLLQSSKSYASHKNAHLLQSTDIVFFVKNLFYYKKFLIVKTLTFSTHRGKKFYTVYYWIIPNSFNTFQEIETMPQHFPTPENMGFLPRDVKII